MIILKILIFCVVLFIVLVLGFIWGYKHGEHDAYLEFVQKEDYYQWLLETKRKENFE